MLNKIVLIIFLVSVVSISSAKELESSLYSLEGKWLDQNNHKYSLSDLAGNTVVLAMVYTTCDYSCPLITRKLVLLSRKTSELGKKVRFILITFDPIRDTPKRLKKYSLSQKLDEEKFSLLTANEPDTHRLAMALDFKYKRLSSGHFSHSNTISVLDQKGRLVYQQDIGVNDDSLIKVIRKISRSSETH